MPDIVISGDEELTVTVYGSDPVINVKASNPAVTALIYAGSKGDPGTQGGTGDKGDPGDAATISIGTVTTLPAGSPATVTNSGTTSAAVFNFGIPSGADGAGAVQTVNGIGPDDNGNVEIGAVGYVTPESFGAAGNGTTDDSAALQAALNAGGTVYITKPHYIASSLSVPSNSRIISNGGKLICGYASGNNFYNINALTIQNKQNVYIEGLTFDGGCDATYTTSVRQASMVRVLSSSGVTFSRCTFQHYDSHQSPLGSDNFSCFFGQASSEIVFDLCKWDHIHKEGISLWGCNHVTFRNCYICMNTSDGYTDIGLLAYQDENENLVLCSDILIEDTTIVNHINTTSAINAMGDRIVIRGCRIEAPNSKYGIDYGNEITSTALPMSDLLIENCYLKCKVYRVENDNHPISATAHDKIIIRNCVFDNTGRTLAEIPYWVCIHTVENGLFIVEGCKFIGNTSITEGSDTKTTWALDYRTGYHGANSKVIIRNNEFWFSGLYGAGNLDGVYFQNNVFHTTALVDRLSSSHPAATGKVLMLGDVIEGSLGAANNGSLTSIALIGCAISSQTYDSHWVSVDDTLSYKLT